jgi:hypothetical protein
MVAKVVNKIQTKKRMMPKKDKNKPHLEESEERSKRVSIPSQNYQMPHQTLNAD